MTLSETAVPRVSLRRALLIVRDLRAGFGFEDIAVRGIATEAEARAVWRALRAELGDVRIAQIFQGTAA